MKRVMDSVRFAVGVVIVTLTATTHAMPCGSSDYPFPFTDVAGVGDAFCPGILEAYVLGVTRGSTPTTFTPNADVTRLQMTTFLQRSIDQTLRRSSRRAALGQWWTPTSATGLRSEALPGAGPAFFCKSDGERVWVATGDRVVSVRAANGEPNHSIPLSHTGATGVLVAYGRVTVVDPVTGNVSGFRPLSSPPYSFEGAFNFGPSYHPNQIAFDGNRFWTANFADESIAIVPLGANGVPTGTGVVVPGFVSPVDIVFDGTNMWVSEAGAANRIRRLDANGVPLQAVNVGQRPSYMAYDGANLWVPNQLDDSVTVIQASTGAIVATIASDAANRLAGPVHAAFDGERVLVSNPDNDSVTLFRAADLSLIRNLQLQTGSAPFGACSDGIDFWVVLWGSGRLLRL